MTDVLPDDEPISRESPVPIDTLHESVVSSDERVAPVSELSLTSESVDHDSSHAGGNGDSVLFSFSVTSVGILYPLTHHRTSTAIQLKLIFVDVGFEISISKPDGDNPLTPAEIA